MPRTFTAEGFSAPPRMPLPDGTARPSYAGRCSPARWATSGGRTALAEGAHQLRQHLLRAALDVHLALGPAQRELLLGAVGHLEPGARERGVGARRPAGPGREHDQA